MPGRTAAACLLAGLCLSMCYAQPWPKGQPAEFALHDIFGREVRSSDYEGVPLLLEFGACW